LCQEKQKIDLCKRQDEDRSLSSYKLTEIQAWDRDRYDTFGHQQTFLRRKLEGGQVPEPIGLDDLMRLILSEIQQTAAQHLTDFPLDAIGVPSLKRILEVVRIVAGVNTPGEREDFSAFLQGT